MKEPARLFKALADETRLRILALLLMHGELCVCHIMASLQLPQSTASRHLAYLKNSGWLDDRREGLWVYYSISARADELRAGAADILRSYLPSLPTVAADRERLAVCLEQGGCK